MQWLADAVRDGRIRWVLTGGDGGFAATTAASARARSWPRSQKVGKEVDSVSGLYDLQGQADALLAAAS